MTIRPMRPGGSPTRIASRHPEVRCIRRVSERGLSSAVLTGMQAAGGRALAVIDSDLQHDERALARMVRPILDGTADVVVGSREAEGGSYGDWGKWRRFVSWTGKQLARRMVGVDVSDPMSGFFVISRSWYDRLREDVDPRGFKILLEFLARGPKPRLAEVGYVFRERQHGHTKLTSSVIGSFVVALVDLFFGRVVSASFTAYAIVGVIGVAVRFSVESGANIVDLPEAAQLGFLVSVGTNYVLNNRFTFARYAFRGRQHYRGFAVFLLVSLHGLLVQAGVSTLAEEQFPDSGQMLATLFGIAIATAGNYLLNSTLTWHAHRPATL